MPSDLDNLIDTLKRQRTDIETDMQSTGEKDAADLVDKLQELRKRSEDTDETWRRSQGTPPPGSTKTPR